ncbi:MAG: hypothetical protein U0694_27775 [Anaerolineae bacterium]
MSHKASVRETYRAEDKHLRALWGGVLAPPDLRQSHRSVVSTGNSLAAPDDKEFIRFCPALRQKIWDITDECPHRKVNVPAYMDRIYSLTVDRVNQITLEEEAPARGDDKDAWASQTPAYRQRQKRHLTDMGVDSPCC